MPTEKDEDKCGTWLEPVEGVADALFGVFDGHGGRAVAELVATRLVDQISVHAR